MGTFQISFNGGQPYVTDQNALASAEATDPNLNQALALLQSMDTYAATSAAGQNPGQAINFTLDGANVTLQNPGGVLNNLISTWNGQNVTDQSVTQTTGTTIDQINNKLNASDSLENIQSGLNLNELVNPSMQDLLTPAEMQAYSTMDPADQQQYKLQMVMEWESRLVTLLTNLLKMKHDTMMSVIGNIRSS
jgi:predicted ribonuclease toxin of YeeF-YezG toxin-antitoxin module